MQQSYLYVPAEGPATLFARKVVERARLESPLDDIVALPSLRDLPRLVAERYGAPAGARRPRARRAAREPVPPPRGAVPGVAFADIGADVVRQRAVKSAWEVERIRAAAALADEVYALVPGLLDEGMTEAELAGRVEAEARRLGHEGVIRMRGFNQEMFYGQLLTGVSGAAATFLDTPLGGIGLSPAVAQGVSFRRIRRGDHVVFDFVAVREGYIADFTRIFALGPLHPELARAYDVARRAQDAVEGGWRGPA